MVMNWDTFKSEMFQKYDNGENLSENELKWLAEFAFYEVEGDEHRWTMDTKSIVELDGRYLAVDWDRGLTESQENTFYNQPYEVKKESKVVTQTVIEWKPIE